MPPPRCADNYQLSVIKHHPGVMLLFFVVLLLCGNLSSAQVPAVPTTAPGALIDPDDYIRADRLGITFVGFVDNNMGAERYRNALILGSGWTRWPLYWDRVETQPGRYDWSAYDRLLATDIRHGLRTNAILLGRPAFLARPGTVLPICSSPSLPTARIAADRK